MTSRIKSKKLKGEVFINVFGIYALSNMGRWYSYSRKKIIKQKKNSSGYLRACLYINKKNKWVLTHIKVVELFGDSKGNKIPEGFTCLLKNGFSIDHLNKNRADPRACNLELVTHKENCRRKYAKKEEE